MMLRARRMRVKAAPRIEPLDSRLLLSAGASNVWPLPASGPGDSLFVRFAANETAAEEQAALAKVGGRVLHVYPAGPAWVGLGEGVDPSAAAASLGAQPGVVYAEPDATIHVKSVYPTDPGFTQQWGLSQANGVSIDAPAAWSVTTGNPATIVAVLDTGVDMTHPDLAGKLWTNPADGTHGYNFVNSTEYPQDDNGHGTHVAGIIAAAGDNGVGIVGVNWNAQIMALKFLDATGNGSTDDAVTGIYYAVAHGARVINASWGGSDFSQSLYDAIAYAGAHNVVFVTAAGNDGTNNDYRPSYPADDRLPNELSVAAIDASGRLPSWSNYGLNTVDLAAPGVGILSTVPGGYASWSGTSMATPFVTGVVSLLVGQHPEYSASQLVATVRATAKPLPSLAGKVATGGMVDAARALGVYPTPPQPQPQPVHVVPHAVVRVRHPRWSPPRRRGH